MKICKYCRTVMDSEYETNPNNTHRYKGYHTCPSCGALCDDDVTEKGNQRIVHSEKWFSPDEKTGEQQ